MSKIMETGIACAIVWLMSLVATASASDGWRMNGRLWDTDGAVYAMAKSENTLFIGGRFTYVGPHTGGGAAVDLGTGAVLPSPTGYLEVQGTVAAVVSDGLGGWYIGGRFSKVGGEARQNLAHILADGSLAPWQVSTDSDVLALAMGSSLLYVGGAFTRVQSGGPVLNLGHLIAVDPATGAVQAWGQNVAGNVTSIVTSNDFVYVAGQFTQIGSATGLNGLAQLRAADGSVTSWRQTAINRPTALAVDGSNVYAGASRTVAALDSNGALRWSKTLTLGSDPRSIAVLGGTVYLAGRLGYGSPRRSNLISFTTEGADLAWAPAPDNTVRAVATAGSLLIAVGDFLNVGGTARERIAAFNPEGALVDWNPSANGAGTCAAAYGTTAYVGGVFTHAGGAKRANLAAIDVVSGRATEWAPGTDADVLAVAVSGSTVYVGGNFQHIGGQTRIGIAAVDQAGNVTAWDQPTDNKPVYCLTVAGNRLYAGGAFARVGSVPARFVTAFNLPIGEVAWPADAPGVSAPVLSIAVTGDKVFVGGQFLYVGTNTPRPFIAALGPMNGSALSWNPVPDIRNGLGIISLVATDEVIYPAGYYELPSDVAGTLHGFSAATGAVRNWTGPTIGSTVAVAARDPRWIWVANSNEVFSLNAATGALTPLGVPITPNGGSGGIRVLTADDTHVYAGGGFRDCNGRSRWGLVAFEDFVSPVNVSDLQASVEDTDVLLQWRSIGTPNRQDQHVLRSREGAAPDMTDIAIDQKAGGVCAARDRSVEPGRYVYSVAETQPDGTTLVLASITVEVPASASDRCELLPAVPNPFNPTTQLRFRLARASQVDLKIVDARGRLVAHPVTEQTLAAGAHAVSWDGRSRDGKRAASGVYIATLSVGSQAWSQRLVLLK